MVYAAGIVLVVMAAVLLGIFSRSMILGDGGTGLMDFSELYFWGQWAGFWCAVASLGFFALSARMSPLALVSRRALAPGVAMLLCLSFMIFSVPEWSNRRVWKNGVVGGRAYVETKLRRWREQRAAEAMASKLREALQGRWRSAEGETLEVEAARVVLRGRSGERVMELLEAECPDGGLKFEMADRREVGYLYFRAGMSAVPDWVEWQDGRLPLLTFNCNGRYAGFVSTGPGRLFAVLYDGTSLNFTR